MFEECTKASSNADQALAAWAREEEQLTGLQRAHADHAENAGAQQDLAQAQIKTARQEQELKDAYAEVGLALQVANEEEGWILMTAHKTQPETMA